METEWIGKAKKSVALLLLLVLFDLAEGGVIFQLPQEKNCGLSLGYLAHFILSMYPLIKPPQLTRESPPEPQVIEGNDLHLDVRVQGYPYPWVTWRHRDYLLQNKSNVDSETRLKIRNVTVLEGG
ncbi:hypothetical protein pdam_00015666, partial [Pocillopora damicornis]